MCQVFCCLFSSSNTVIQLHPYFLMIALHEAFSDTKYHTSGLGLFIRWLYDIESKWILFREDGEQKKKVYVGCGDCLVIQPCRNRGSESWMCSIEGHFHLRRQFALQAVPCRVHLTGRWCLMDAPFKKKKAEKIFYQRFGCFNLC